MKSGSSQPKISNNSAEASRGSSEIAQNIMSVSQIASSSTEAANNTSAAADELSRLAMELNDVVGRFKITPTSEKGTSGIDPETRPLVSVGEARDPSRISKWWRGKSGRRSDKTF